MATKCKQCIHSCKQIDVNCELHGWVKCRQEGPSAIECKDYKPIHDGWDVVKKCIKHLEQVYQKEVNKNPVWIFLTDLCKDYGLSECELKYSYDEPTKENCISERLLKQELEGKNNKVTTTIKFKDIKDKIPFNRIEFFDSNHKNIYFIDYRPSENLNEYLNLVFKTSYIDGRDEPILQLQLSSKDDFKVVEDIKNKYADEKKKRQNLALEKERKKWLEAYKFKGGSYAK